MHGKLVPSEYSETDLVHDGWPGLQNVTVGVLTMPQDQYAMQIGIRVTDMIGDVVIAVLPIFLMLKLQTSWKSRMLVMVLFGTRIM